MADHKLVLHPANPWAILQDPPELLDSLRQLGLIDTSFSHLGEVHHKAGRRFGKLVVSRGGSVPQPAANGTAPHLVLSDTTPEPVFLGGTNARAPSCPGCQNPFGDWRRLLQEWQSDRRQSWTCARCGRRRQAHELDWSRRGGFGRYALEIWNIREEEATPSPELLELLRVVTFEDWTYFYYRF